MTMKKPLFPFIGQMKSNGPTLLHLLILVHSWWILDSIMIEIRLPHGSDLKRLRHG
jgi:hypothetical protein